MKKDPDKFTSLIYNDIYSPSSLTLDYLRPYHATFDLYGRDPQYPSPDHYSEGCIDMLVHEAEKIYNKFAKECIDGSVDDYTDTVTSSSPSLPPPFDVPL